MRELVWFLFASIFVLAVEGRNCHTGYSEQGVQNTEVKLSVCKPVGPTLNCDHCTHAGSRTACWKLDSRCLNENTQEVYRLENWGFGNDGKWQKNHDLQGNYMYLTAVCKDQYGGYCFQETDSNAFKHAPNVLLLLSLCLIMT